MKKNELYFDEILEVLKEKVDLIIEEGLRISQQKSIGAQERDCIIQSVVEKKMIEGIEKSLKEIEGDNNITKNEVNDELKKYMDEIRKYCKRKLRQKMGTGK